MQQQTEQTGTKFSIDPAIKLQLVTADRNAIADQRDSWQAIAQEQRVQLEALSAELFRLQQEPVEGDATPPAAA